jgi:hypothetical protein
MRLYEAEAAYHYATQLAPERLRIHGGWARASLLRMAIEEAFERAHSEGRHSVDLRTLSLPDREEWQRQLALHARECLERIVRIHSQRRVAANSQFFGELASEHRPD